MGSGRERGWEHKWGGGCINGKKPQEGQNGDGEDKWRGTRVTRIGM
jgi:hypothetical protein